MIFRVTVVFTAAARLNILTRSTRANPAKKSITRNGTRGGKYECIDVMTDVFGVDAVRNFCKLNAFKYIWREQNKNGVEDIKKAVWYLNKLIELSENANENV